jgi:hypothetical protein
LTLISGPEINTKNRKDNTKLPKIDLFPVIKSTVLVIEVKQIIKKYNTLIADITIFQEIKPS